MRKFLIVYIVLFLFFAPVYAAIVDDSIDESIKRTYRTDIVEKNLLPSLPKTLPEEMYESESESTIFTPEEKTMPVNNSVKTQSSQVSQSYNREYKEIKVKKGTRFKVRLQNSVGDTTPRGTKINFVSVYPETSRYVTIPSGTVFRGQVLNSHPPQFIGNGGLIELKIDELVYKKSAYHIDSKVSIANYKRIYLNNIKGRQNYLKNMGNITRPGNKFMHKMWGVSSRLNGSGAEVVLIPVAVVCGVVVYGFNLVLSPVLSLFTMGGAIKIPSGSYFEIKLTEDAIIRDY